MYLNIINNTLFENRRNKNMSQKKNDQDADILEHNSNEKSFYFIEEQKSIFYGELTKNWISIRQR